ncbi:uncharacterized protein LODBEIA_P53640 [Lodderomyces beijingensis]|uniref:Uncharacterized protein n=1 Tax=Lodderomyces beijingensis TaxID=1775926 RepID=A0ABP0ZSN4_9ASCO
MSSQIYPSAISYTDTVTPSLTNLLVATTTSSEDDSGPLSLLNSGINNNALEASSNESSSDSHESSALYSIHHTTPTASGLVYQSDTAHMTGAKGTFAASSDVRTLNLATATATGSSSGSAVADKRKIKLSLIMSGMAFISFVFVA